jgi:hypothetical protein
MTDWVALGASAAAVAVSLYTLWWEKLREKLDVNVFAEGGKPKALRLVVTNAGARPAYVSFVGLSGAPDDHTVPTMPLDPRILIEGEIPDLPPVHLLQPGEPIMYMLPRDQVLFNRKDGRTWVRVDTTSRPKKPHHEPIPPWAFAWLGAEEGSATTAAADQG